MPRRWHGGTGQGPGRPRKQNKVVFSLKNAAGTSIWIAVKDADDAAALIEEWRRSKKDKAGWFERELQDMEVSLVGAVYYIGEEDDDVEAKKK